MHWLIDTMIYRCSRALQNNSIAVVSKMLTASTSWLNLSHLPPFFFGHSLCAFSPNVGACDQFQ